MATNAYHYHEVVEFTGEPSYEYGYWISSTSESVAVADFHSRQQSSGD
jgi:hypothetical protein